MPGDGPKTFSARNPRTGQIDFTFTPPSGSETAAAAMRARAAQAGWGALPLEGRIAALGKLSEAIEDHRAAIAGALEADTGRRRIAQREVAGVVAAIEAWCAIARASPVFAPQEWIAGRTMAQLRHGALWRPYPLVGVISPWNFPLLLSLIDAIPALLAGAAVLVKPSEVTPRFAGPLGEAVRAGGLEALLQIAPGGAETGEALIDVVDCVCFTGSVATGRRVAGRAAQRLIPAFLELGGKDPLVITATADLDRAADAALRGGVAATGQACQSIERIYVQRVVHDAFLDRLVARARQVRFNWPDISHGEIGPLIWGPQADRLAVQIEDARAKGARVLTGGVIEHHGGGLWLAPTVLADVTHAMAVMQEETFGPILPVMAYDTPEEAAALANFGEYGLSAAVFAGALEEAAALGARIEAGAISLNDAALTVSFQEAAKHSFKASGLGPSRMGAEGLTRFFRRQALIANTGAPTPLSAFAEDGGF